MKIFALDSDTEEFQELINSLAEKISIDLFDDFESLMEAVDEECQAVLLDFDSDQRKKNKMLAQVKKSYADMNIFLLANSLDAKKLSKHQKSKTGANVYFQTPVDPDILDSILEPFIGYDDTPIAEEDVLKEHQAVKNPNATATDVSKNIDGAFSSTFFDEYADEGELSAESDDGGLSDISLDHATDSEIKVDEVAMDEISMDEMSLDGDNEVQMEEVALDTAVDEVSMSDDEIESMSLAADDDEGFSLDNNDDNSEQVDEWKQEDDLSLTPGDDAAGNVAFPDEDDLTFPEVERPDFSLTEESESAAESGLQEMELADEGSLVEMDISSEEMVAAPEDDAMEMDLSGGDELAIGESGEVDSVDMAAPNEIALDAVDELQESDDVLTVAADASVGDELSLGEESQSGVFDLTADDTDADELAGINLGSDSADDSASDMNTSAELVTGMDDDLSSEEVVDEITKTQMTNPLEGLEALSAASDDDEPLDLDLTADDGETEEDDDLGNLSLNVPNYMNEDLSGEDSIGDLLNQAANAESNAPDIQEYEMPLSEESQIINRSKDMTETGLTIQVVALPKGLGKEVSQKGITFANKADPSRPQPQEERVETKTSIQLTDESLSSIDLPDTPEFAREDQTLVASPFDDELAQAYEEQDDEFSTTVHKKLQEIDNMIDDESELEDKTMVVDRSAIETNIYATQGISDDTTMAHAMPQELDDATVVMRTPDVPQDLKQEHRDYVQSHDEELIRLGETIKSLREDRESLMNKLADFESQKDEEKREVLDLKAQLDEKNIELVVIKKRMEKLIDDLRFQLDIAVDKKDMYAKQNENLKREVEKLSRQTKLDVNKIRARERELEEKLEMLRNDAEVQIRNRDQKILELKRRIDTLEFDVESSHVKEKQSIDSQMDLQDKMDKVIKTLRGAIGQLEDDYGADERKKNIKKNLDI